MLVIIISAILSICIAIIIQRAIYGSKNESQKRMYRYYHDESEWYTVVLLSTLLISSLVLIPTIQSVKYETKTEVVRSFEKNIAALKDNVNVSGLFFLGIGAVNEKMHYYGMVEEDDGYILKEFPADKIIVVETDNPTEKPKYVQEYTVRKKRQISQIPRIVEVLAYPFIRDAYGVWTEGLKANYKEKIFVPKGTILKNYTIDLQ